MSVKITLPEGTKIPNHIAIIPDGNRRWARARGIPTLKGHETGFKMGVELGRAARSWGIHTVTFWGFSTENWDRSPREVAYLMKLYSKMVDEYLEDAHKEKVKIVHLGRKDRLPKFLVKKLQNAENETKDYDKFIANIALDYGGHDEIIRAVKKMIESGIPSNEISKKTFENYLDTKNQPYPYVDLLIRTSGEMRTSGLLLWQMEYAEMYWECEHFPSFTPERLSHAILDYSRRRRRFGGNDDENHFVFKPEVVANFELNWWRLANIPEGTKFRDYAIAHIAEQWGMSKKIASKAAIHFILGLKEGNKNNWKKAVTDIAEFYKLVRDEVKLAFEPNIVAGLEVKILQRIKDASDHNLAEDVEEATKRLVSEVYRLSDFQASKAAHLRAMATVERKLALQGKGDIHWQNAERYLEAYYQVLKDKVA